MEEGNDGMELRGKAEKVRRLLEAMVMVKVTREIKKFCLTRQLCTGFNVALHLSVDPPSPRLKDFEGPMMSLPRPP